MFKSVTYPHLPVILNSNSKILNYMPRLSHRRKYPLLLSSMKLHLKCCYIPTCGIGYPVTMIMVVIVNFF